MSERIPKTGDHVIYCDEKGNDHSALVTCWWGGSNPQGCMNLLHMSADEARQDQYGRQIERPSSVSHASVMQVHGRYWRWPDEAKNPYTPPQA